MGTIHLVRDFHDLTSNLEKEIVKLAKEYLPTARRIAKEAFNIEKSELKKINPEAAKLVDEPQKILNILATSNNPQKLKSALEALDVLVKNRDIFLPDLVDYIMANIYYKTGKFILPNLIIDILKKHSLLPQVSYSNFVREAGRIIAERVKKDVNFAKLVLEEANRGFPMAYKLAKGFGAIREKDVSGNLTRVLIYVAGHEKPIGEWYRESINEGGKLRLFSWSSSEGEEQVSTSKASVSVGAQRQVAGMGTGVREEKSAGSSLGTSRRGLTTSMNVRGLGSMHRFHHMREMFVPVSEVIDSVVKRLRELGYDWFTVSQIADALRYLLTEKSQGGLVDARYAEKIVRRVLWEYSINPSVVGY